MLEEIIFRLDVDAWCSVDGDVVQDLVIGELGEFGDIREMMTDADGDGHFHAGDAGFVNHETLVLLG